MKDMLYVFLVLLALILCTANIYSMHNFGFPAKTMFCIFGAMTLICMAVNIGILAIYGRTVFNQVNIATLAVPYFIVFLILSKDRISQVFFNFWLWVNFYAGIITFVNLINDLTFRKDLFVDVSVIICLFLFFVVYNKYLRTYHRRLLETLRVNWWVFSMIPLGFEVLIVMINQIIPVPDGYARNYPMLAVIFLLMGLIYGLLIYTFHMAHAVTESELTKAIQSQQLDAAKTQIEFLREAQTRTAIYRHDMRHNLAAIDALLSAGNVQKTRDYINQVQSGIEALTLRHFCENNLVNLLCSSFSDKAERAGIRLTVDTVLPEALHISDMELCAIVSNGLENAFRAVGELENDRRWIELHSSIRQDKLLIEIRNPYAGQVSYEDEMPVSDREGHGHGCRSIRSIAQQHRGVCLFEAEDGVFVLRVVLPMNSDRH